MLVAEGSNARPLIRSAAPERPLRILVVDDHEVMRSGLRWLLTRVPWVECCAGAATAEEALELARSLAFDVALVDVDLGAECGLAACARLCAAAPGLYAALLTTRWDLVPMRAARAAGARGAIAKDRPARELLRAVRALAAGVACAPEPARPGEIRFTPRERDILRLVAAGLTNAEIGATLFLAPGTIKHHMLELYDKLGAPNRAAAVHTARRLGLLAEADTAGTPAADPSPAHSLRVLVADEHDARRAGLLLALHGRSWVEACTGARALEDALPAAARLEADVALVADPQVSRALAGARPELRTLLLREDTCSAPALRAAGAAGTVLQRWSGERVADAVLRAGREPRTADVVAGPDPVSPRERDVLAAFASGATNPAIARELGLSPNTVKQHASSIFRKLGVRNRAEAVRRADELGLLAA
ncbi:MAG TPA: response regulator transcription factor [Solirubrobacter sp.]|nr:response regulator transcription factor [Solirubrobacter sp.]